MWGGLQVGFDYKLRVLWIGMAGSVVRQLRVSS